MPNMIRDILKSYCKELKQFFGTSLVKVILFGSYARGDYNKNSDIDLMILVNVPPEQISDFADKIYDLTYDYEQEHDIEINPCIQSIDTYNYWKGVYPFFMNIEKEGLAV